MLVDIGSYSGCTLLVSDVSSVLERVITPGVSSIYYFVTINLFVYIIRLIYKVNGDGCITPDSIVPMSGANTTRSQVNRSFKLFYLRITQVL